MEIELDKIYNMDCLEGMKQIPDKSVNCIITSPPYNFNLRVHYDKYIKSSPFERNRKDGVNENKYGQTCSDDLTIEEYFEWQRKCIDEMLRISSGLVIYNIQLLSGNKPAVLRLLGHYADKIKEILIWDKIHGEPAMYVNTFNSAFEFIIILANENTKARSFDTFNAERGTVDNILRLGKNRGHGKVEGHKACFPLLLPQTLIHLLTNEGDTVLDPFMGSGTTAVACVKEGRHFIGFELSPEYHKKAVQRVQAELAQTRLF